MAAPDDQTHFDRRATKLSRDPFEELGEGAILRVMPRIFGGADVGQEPTVVDNWTFFDGALAALAILSPAGSKVHGTAVMLAPGLAATATHVLEADLDALSQAGTNAILLAPTESGMDVWRVTGVTATRSDITYLSVSLASEIEDAWSVRTVPCTTRMPVVGEKVHMVGFRVDDHDVGQTESSFTARGDLLVSAGSVGEVFPHGRDRLLLNYPAIEVQCGSLGGMSGGAVLDSRGHMLGLVSRGWATTDGVGPSYAAWIIGSLTYRVTLSWPSALGSPSPRVLEIPDSQFHLEGREYVRAIDEEGFDFGYTPWSNQEGETEG